MIQIDFWAGIDDDDWQDAPWWGKARLFIGECIDIIHWNLWRRWRE